MSNRCRSRRVASIVAGDSPVTSVTKETVAKARRQVVASSRCAETLWERLSPRLRVVEGIMYFRDAHSL